MSIKLKIPFRLSAYEWHWRVQPESFLEALRGERSDLVYNMVTDASKTQLLAVSQYTVNVAYCIQVVEFSPLHILSVSIGHKLVNLLTTCLLVIMVSGHLI